MTATDKNDDSLPSEWAKQQGVLLAWPHESTDWKAYLNETSLTYESITKEIAEVEQVFLLCMDAAHATLLKKTLNKSKANLANITFIESPYNDTWTRDYGPITLTGKSQQKTIRKFIDFQFNGWGEKYHATLDNQASQQLYNRGVFGEESNTCFESSSIILEGGGIESDGQGTLLSTPQCVFARNPKMPKETLEAEIKKRLGMQRILWLNHGHLENDDTDGHIDTLARFCSTKSIAYVACNKKDDPLYSGFQVMQEELESFRTLSNKRYELFPLPLPVVFNKEKKRLPATYANFLIMNEKVLVPLYGDSKADNEALFILNDAFPKHHVVGIDCLSLVHQYGSLHCVTMQIPTTR